MGDVVDGVAERNLLGQGFAGLARAHRLLGHDRDRLEARGRIEARGGAVGADHEPAVQRCGDVVGMALQLGG